MIKYVGFNIYSIYMSLYIPMENMPARRFKCMLILKHSNTVKLRYGIGLALLGLWLQNSLQTRGVNSFIEILNEIKSSHSNFDSFACLSHTALADISWWLTNECLEPVLFPKHNVDIGIFSDASLKGWGGYCSTNKTMGHWPAFKSTNLINCQSLLACSSVFCVI